MKVENALGFAMLVTFCMLIEVLLIEAIDSGVMATWTFTGHEFIVPVLEYSPLIFLVLIILIPVYYMATRN